MVQAGGGIRRSSDATGWRRCRRIGPAQRRLRPDGEPATCAQLAALQSEIGRRAYARQSLLRYSELSVLADKHARRWVQAHLSDEAYYCGNLEESPTMQRKSAARSSIDRRAAEEDRGRPRCAAAPARRAGRAVCASAPHDLRARNTGDDLPFLEKRGEPSADRRGNLLRRHAGAQRAVLGRTEWLGGPQVLL